ncbi:hypothetical protein KBA84_06975, partial [Patescibacteria group bacterium]|nr:hypothetical protein [Patescibacteria group bacterium]
MTDFNTIIHQYEYEFNELITSKGWGPAFVEVVDMNDKTTQTIELSLYREPLPPYDQIPDKIEKPLETIIPLYDSKGHYR